MNEEDCKGKVVAVAIVICFAVALLGIILTSCQVDAALRIN